MLLSLLKLPGLRWGTRSLSAKALLPGAALILLSLVGSAIVFLSGNQIARRCLLAQQMSAKADVVTETLSQRVDAVASAGAALASDPEVARALLEGTDVSLGTLRESARAVGDRFELAFVQIYDHRGVAQVDLAPLGICIDPSATSSLLQLAESGQPVARAVDDHLFLLGRSPISEPAGTVVVGIDLGTELIRMRANDQLSVDLALRLRGTQIGTITGLPSDAENGWVDDHYWHTQSTNLGSTPAELLLIYPSRDIKRLTHAGLVVALSSTLLATLLLIHLNQTVIRSFERPIRDLTGASKAVGKGQLDQKVWLASNPLTLGEDDDLGLLVNAFNEMTDSLQDRRTDLEANAKLSAAGLAIAADVARAVSSSLELDVILGEAVRVIKRHLSCVCPGVYHVGIYLNEQDAAVLVLREAASPARDELVRKGIKVPVGSKSPVGHAVANRRLKGIENVKLASMHLKPPLLMDTYSAVAVPLLIGDRCIGALDLQSKRPGAFPAETFQLLKTLAHQIASAVHNADSYQQQREAAGHLAEMDQLKTQFLAVMSHKMRSPLKTIIGLATGLLEDGVASLTDQQARDVRFIQSLGQHLAALTDDFLDISKMRASTITLTLQDVNVRLLIESALDAVAPLIKGKPITFCANIEPDLPVVRADKRRVRQVMLSLLSNVAASTECGSINVCARTTEALNVNEGRMDPFVEVRIGATGLGMSEREMNRGSRALPRPCRSKASTCGAANSALPITESLIDAHGGRIWMDRRCGEGATFTFILPLDPPDALRARMSDRPKLASEAIESCHST